MADLALPPSTSASQLTTYVMCPRRFAFQYVLGVEPEFRSVALVLGSAIHSAVDWWYEERLASRTPTIEDALRIVSSDLLAEIEGHRIRWKAATPGSLDEDARRYLALYLEQHGAMEVAAVEQPFEVELEDSDTGEVRGRKLKGYFDLTLENHRIIELKTSARAWDENALVRHLQLGAYIHAANTLHGGPHPIEVQVIVKLKREPRIETHVVERGEPANRWWLRAAWAIEEAIAAGHFPPSPSPLCGECEFEKACAAWLEEPAMLAPRTRLPVVNDIYVATP
jgi:putative RecB family exonuclease